MSLDNFKNNFKTFQSIHKSQPGWLSDYQSHHFAEFLNKGLPSKKEERWKYSSLKSFAKKDFSWQMFASQSKNQNFDYGKGCYLVFHNGIFCKDLSDDLPKGIQLAVNVSEASFSWQNLQNQFSDFQTDSLLHLNHAFSYDGAFLEVQKNANIQTPLHLIYVFENQSNEAFSFFPRNAIVVNEGASFKFTETYSLNNENLFSHAVTDIFVNENAHVAHDLVQLDCGKAYNMQTTRAIVNKNANYKNMHFTFGSELTRRNLEVELKGTQAESQLYALYPVLEGAHVDHHTWVHHKAMHTQTEQLYKSVVEDGGRGIFNGMIQVYQEAQKSNSTQLNKNLLLGQKAEVDTKPQLLIHADDVKCAHGSTVGQIDEEALFYLNSRGIPKTQAMNILIHGFVNDLLPHISNDGLRQVVESLLEEKFFNQKGKDL